MKPFEVRWTNGEDMSQVFEDFYEEVEKIKLPFRSLGRNTNFWLLHEKFAEPTSNFKMIVEYLGCEMNECKECNVVFFDEDDGCPNCHDTNIQEVEYPYKKMEFEINPKSYANWRTKKVYDEGIEFLSELALEELNFGQTMRVNFVIPKSRRTSK